MNKHFLTFSSSKLNETSINGGLQGFLAYMQATYPGQFDSAYFSMSYIQKYAGGHVMLSDVRLVNTLLGYDFTRTRKLDQPILQVELDIPTIITTMEAEYTARSNKLKKELDNNGLHQEHILEREDEWKSGKLSEEMSVLIGEEEMLLHKLDMMTYYFDLDTSALEAKHRLNQGSESKDDLELIAQAEQERIVPVGVMIHLPELETISFAPSQVKMFNTDTAHSWPAPAWITDSQVQTTFNRLLSSKDQTKIYTVGNVKTVSPLVQRRTHEGNVIFKIQFLGTMPMQDLSYAMLTSTFVTFERGSESVSVKFEPEKSNKGGGDQRNSSHRGAKRR